VPPQNDHQPGPPPQAQGAGPPAEKPDKPDNGHPKADA
jgi:hypothetical protein